MFSLLEESGSKRAGPGVVRVVLERDGATEGQSRLQGYRESEEGSEPLRRRDDPAPLCRSES